MTTTLSSPNTATLGMDGAASLTIAMFGKATIAFTSANDDVWPSFTVTNAQSKTYGPYGINMSVVITALDGSLTYQVNGGVPGFGYDADSNITSLVDGAGNQFGVAKKRIVPSRNGVNPENAWGPVQTLGTVTDVTAGTHSTTALVTTTGSTGRIFGGCALTLETTKMYEAAVTVDDFYLPNFATMVQGWFGIPIAPTAGTQELRMQTTPPVIGQRFAIRFQPATTSVTIRMGFGINNNEQVTAGNWMRLSGLSVNEVTNLMVPSPVPPYGYSAYGSTGIPQAKIATPGSCVYCIGDSWTEPTSRYAATLARVYGREVVVTATAGHTMADMQAAVTAALGTGVSYLNQISRNVPGLWMICGGINDIAADAGVDTLKTRSQWLIDQARAHNCQVLFITQPLATNAAMYTSGRLGIRAAWVAWLKQEGCDVLDLQASNFLDGAGAANPTLMEDAGGLWVHPTSPDGVDYMVELVEPLIRSIDRAGVLLSAPKWP